MDVGYPVPVLGRDAQLAVLGRLVDGATAGRGALAWIEGEPGIGKTALADAVAARAGAAGHRVLRGGGDELMQPFPLRLMADCLGVTARSQDPAAAEIAALLRGGEQMGAAGPVLAAAERMLELVDRLCTRSPVTLVVEDLHWSDEHSLLLWGRLARAVDQIPLLLVGVTRPLPQRDAVDRLRSLAETRGGTVLRLGPLEPGEAALLAARIAGAAPGPRLAAELGRAGGNPLYIRELVDALVGGGLVAAERGSAELRGGTGAMPSSLAVAIGRRLGFLSEPTRRALRIAALLGNDVDAADWALAAGRPVPELADLAAEAVAGGVLSDAEGRLRFRHELIRQALVEQTPQAVRSALHGSIARSLADAGRGVDAVARHLLTGPATAEDWELTWLIRIGEAALYAAPLVAAELLERAVASVQPDDPRWTVLATRLAQVLFWLGRDPAAYALAGEVARRTDDPVLRCRMRIQMIRLAGRLGRFAEVLPMTLHAGDEGVPALWRARLAAWSALILLYTGSPEQSLATARAALELAGSSGDPLSIATAYHASYVCDGPAARRGHMRAALAVLTSRDLESMDLRMLLLANYVTLLMDLGESDECEEVLAEALRLAERSGTFRAAAIQAGAVASCYQFGRFDDALVHIAGIEVETFGNEEMLQVHGDAAMIALRREDRAGADARLRAAIGPEPPDPRRPPAPSYPLTEALALRAEADGDPRLAFALMAPWLDAPLGLRRQERHDDLPYLVTLALEVGETGAAARAVEVAAADAAADPSPSRVCAARCCRALVAGDADELLAVAAEYQGYRWVLKASFAFEQAAVRLARAGEIVRARAALNEAVRMYADAGATWDVKRADARLRPYGVRRGPRSVHRRATVGWESLTPSERVIAALVAQGRSNPDIAAELFLSRRTVQTHVSRILAKLQLHSRMDVIRAAAARQEPARSPSTAGA
jgi:DNA-binding CsgD family transcriptional regulator/tetratricopeptide (TPR) repeat protein